MMSYQRKAVICGLLLVFIAVLFTSALPAQAGRMSLEPVPATQIYLPLVTKPPVYLLGKITDKGVPAVGQSVVLRFYDGVSYSTSATTITDANGDYQIEANQGILPGQSMYILWNNVADNDAWLSVWVCNDIEVNPTADVNCSFDIENIKQSPSLADITLPYTFAWTKRSSPGNSYFYELAEMQSGAPWYESSPLGYVNSFRMNNLPGGFMTNTLYGWWITVCSASGCGDSYYYYEVNFLNYGTSSAKQQSSVKGAERPGLAQAADAVQQLLEKTVELTGCG